MNTNINSSEYLKIDDNIFLQIRDRGHSLIKVSLLGIVAKATANWVLNAASSTGTCCGSPEPVPNTK